MDWLSLIIGFIIGLLFARSPWAKRIGLDSSVTEVKQLTAEVLEENTSKTQTIMQVGKNNNDRRYRRQKRISGDTLFDLLGSYYIWCLKLAAWILVVYLSVFTFITVIQWFTP